MAQNVVQARCPGCSATLRIPAEWLGQPIRCKGCGTVVQARKPQMTGAPAVPPAPATAPSAPPRVTDRTPLPGKRPAPPALPPTATEAVKLPPSITPVVTAPVAAPIAPPVAVPAARKRKGAAGTPFDFGAEEEQTADTEEAEDEEFSPSTSSGKRTKGSRRRRKSGGWIGIAVALGILLITGVGLVIALPKIKAQLQAKAPSLDDDGELFPGVDGGGAGKKGGVADGKQNGGSSGGQVIPIARGEFPRRALIISVHNYLYANPIYDAPMQPNAPPNIPRLMAALSNSLNLSMNQIFHLSDNSRKDARPPLKTVIEQGLQNFLATTRAQDRIFVFFVGHAKEVDGEAYLVPLEGELTEAKTLIPLKWVYEQLDKCKARQKILVIDGNRINPAQGEERPVPGPMSEKFEAALKSPPKGVQVWASCSKDEQSYEFEEATLGLFLDNVRMALSPEKGQKGALEGRIQRHNDLIPLEQIHAKVKEYMVEANSRRKIKQTPILAGSMPESGADYDPEEASAKAPAMPTIKTGDPAVVRTILSEISVPPLKATAAGAETNQDAAFSVLPPFPEDVLRTFKGGDLPAESKVRKAVQAARVAMWGVSTFNPPREIAAEVADFRSRQKSDLSIMRDSYNRPAAGQQAETNFKNQVFADSQSMARIIARLENILDQFKEAEEELETAPPRWKANFNFIRARFLGQLTYLEEYQYLLGSMRKEFPPFDPMVHTSGWKMAAKEKPSDGQGKRLDKEARKLYDGLIKMAENTPWEVLAKREKLTALGLDWQAF